MKIWAIADLHLSFGVAGKDMDVFGPAWENHAEKLEQNWREKVGQEDLVLLAGDISWAMKLNDALVDMEWIDKLSGLKVIVRGNHDYWWSSVSKMKELFPPSIHLLQNNAMTFGDISIGGARLWDTDEFSFEGYIDHVSKYDEKKNEAEKQTEEINRKIFERELGRLELSLKALDQKANQRIVMTHYPPVGPNMEPTQVSNLLEKYNVDTCVFGHLHNVHAGSLPFGEARGITYHLTSCDYIDFIPIRIN